MSAQAPQPHPPAYAARLDIDYPERLDRVSSAFRLIWIIPIAIVFSLLSASTTSTVKVINETGDFIYIEPGVPHEVFNISETEPLIAFVARSTADEWDQIINYPSDHRPAPENTGGE